MTALEDLGPLLDGIVVPPQHDAPIRTAVKAIEAGRVDEAARILEGVNAVDPHPVTQWLLGVAHLARADVYRAAPGARRRGGARSPELWQAHLARALVLEVLQEFDGAAEALRRVLQVCAEHVGAIAALARCYNEVGKLDRAEALARRGLGARPEEPGAAQRAGGHPAPSGASRRGRRRACASADALSPGDEASAVAFGGSLLRLYRAPEAQAIFEEVLRRNSESTGRAGRHGRGAAGRRAGSARRRAICCAPWPPRPISAGCICCTPACRRA
jgi:tetratricopeptide (TPR) repeat protein